MKTNTSRQLMILHLFEKRRPVWTVGQMVRALKLPESTVYRHVRNLVSAQFLYPVTGAGYALGPAFIRFESILRETDPLIVRAAPLMAALLEQTSPGCTILLSRRFKDCVMCIHEVRGSKAGETGYGRGVAMSMFLGATSKAILAQLPARTLKTIYLSNEQTIRKLLRMPDWNTFQAHIRYLRKDGFVVTEGEVHKGRIGISAPITSDGRSLASITLVCSSQQKHKVKAYIPLVCEAAARISELVARDAAAVSR